MGFTVSPLKGNQFFFKVIEKPLGMRLSQRNTAQLLKFPLSFKLVDKVPLDDVRR